MNNLGIALSAAAGNGIASASSNPNAWNISYSELDHTNSAGFFDIDEMVLAHQFDTASTETVPRGMAFKPDGTKMYICGSQGRDIGEYNLSTAWYPSTATFSQSFSVNSQDTVPRDIYFSDDGLKFFIVGDTNNSVFRYDLDAASPWDISTASHEQTLSVSAKETLPSGIQFKPDGSKMYISGDSSDNVHEYNLTTDWDLNTATWYQSYSLASPTNYENRPMGFYMHPEGTAFWISGIAGDGVDEFTLTTPWDISSASHVQYLKLYNNPAGNSAGNINATAEYQPFGIYWSPDGDHFYMCGNKSTDVHHYKAGVKYLHVETEEIAPNGLFFKSDGMKVYVTGNSGDDINEYTLTTEWDVSTASFSQNRSCKSDNSVMIAPQGLFFKPDGSKVYVTGSSSDVVAQYDLTTDWDISTMSHTQNFSVSAKEANPAGVFFKDDGLKMYVIGFNSDSVHEYDLDEASPWDISTATFNQSFSVSSQETAPRGVFFKTDGLKMYVCGSNGDDVNEYDLDPAWDISTANFLQNFREEKPLDGVLSDIFFKPDGTRYWIIGTSFDTIYQYNIRSS
jgi:DNA-binding beta-propeller fold protein YncE